MTHTLVGRPQEQDMMSAAASFPQYETKIIEPVGVGIASEGVNCASWRGTCTQHNQDTLPQRNSEVVNLTGLLKTKDYTYSVENDVCL